MKRRRTYIQHEALSAACSQPTHGLDIEDYLDLPDELAVLPAAFNDAIAPASDAGGTYDMWPFMHEDLPMVVP